MSDNIMVEVEHITKVFGKVTAVNDISLKIHKGEFVSLLGPSGCGKTTLLRMIGGMETPTTGNIYLQGKIINNLKAHNRPINMVFQRYALFPHLNVYENIAFGPKIKKISKIEIKKKVTEMLKLVQLEGFENRMSNELSGGQCQRVALARALINKPLVLLLDEPLGALDLKLRKAMQIELRNIQRTLGGTFIYVTHDQEEALVLSDRIMVMNEGKIVQTGSPTEIYKNPNTIFSSKFIGESNLLEGTVETNSKPNDTMDIKVGENNVITYFGDNIDKGKKVYLSIRYENIALSREVKTGQDNIFSGNIKNFIFLGPVVKYDIEVPDLKCVICALIHAGNGQDSYYTIGDKVNISWNKYNSTLLFG
jgi:spermidine/putrescine transport system ATP-binding protein